ILEQYDVNLNFYPHYRAQMFFNDEIAPNSDRIKFIPVGIQHVQELLINHALLITDYSSVSFDFVMMNKPVIYYHFDVKRFFRNGILRPIEETFIGEIAYTEEDLINLIKERLENQMRNYDVDISGIIKYQDHKTRERIYSNVHSLVQSKENE